jgi:ribA/ribD-fused uncharacterized protein
MARPFSRRALARGGARSESAFQFFYGHGPRAGDLAVLSNWYVLDRPFKDADGNKFPTSEHHMMHAKAELFSDKDAAARILACPSPAKAKEIGREVRGFDESLWRERALHLVADGCELKFSQCDRCRQVLLSTGDRILVEAAPRDSVWGIGMDASSPARLDPGTWRGSNWLGEALMIVRARLREAAAAASAAAATPSAETRSQCA